MQLSFSARNWHRIILATFHIFKTEIYIENNPKHQVIKLVAYLVYNDYDENYTWRFFLN